ncbi:MAG: type II CAAX prenyl endopeptidase Rce1 family protein [Vulcanimicrobiota bacterium]
MNEKVNEEGTDENIREPGSDSETETEKYTLKDGLQPLLKNWPLLVLFVSWLLFSTGVFISTFSIQKQEGKQAIPQNVAIMEKAINLIFFEDEMGALGREAVTSFGKEVTQEFENILEENPENSEIIYKYYMVKSVFTRNGEEGSEKNGEVAGDVFEKYAPHMENESIKRILYDIYFQEKLEYLEKEKKENYQAMIESNLDNWYKNYTLLRFYQLTEQPDKAEQLTRQLQNQMMPLIYGLIFVALIMTGGLFVGPVILIILIVLTATRYKKSALEFSDLRLKKPESLYNLLSIEKALLIFLVWEIIRNGFGLLARFLFTDYKNFPPLMMFSGYLGVYLFTFFVSFRVISSDYHKFSLSMIGIKIRDFVDGLKKSGLGIAGYFAVVPVVVGLTVLYSLLLKNTPESINPAFDILRNATGTQLVFIWLVIGLFGPIFEEFLFRGIIYTSVRKYMTAMPAIILVSFLFAFIHYDIWVTFNLFVLGAMLALLYERSGSLIPSIVVHCIWNTVTFLTFITLLK